MKKELSLLDFNIAIKPLLNGLFSKTTIDETFFQEILTDIYMNHYVSWYEKYMDPNQVQQFFIDLLNKVNKEFTGKIEIDDITLVNCVLFQNGLCKQISTENITLKKKRTYYVRQWALRISCVVFSVATALFCYLEYFGEAELFISALLTILSSVLSLGQFIKERFSLK